MPVITASNVQSTQRVFLDVALPADRLRSLVALSGGDLHITDYQTGSVMIDFDKKHSQAQAIWVALSLINGAALRADNF